MSPSRTRQKAVRRHRSRRELVTAIGAAAAVVLGTALLIWLLRPGTPGVEGTGGLASRQPRAAWLVGLTLVAVIAFTWWAIRRQRDWRGRIVIVLLVGWVILLLAAVLAGILWPGGLLRHTTPAPDLGDVTNTTLPPELQTTAPAGSETTVAATTPPTGGP
jgi:hypothetical protein